MKKFLQFTLKFLQFMFKGLFALLCAADLWFIGEQTYEWTMTYIMKERSKPYNKKIASLISEGREKIYLDEVFTDIEWDKICIHAQYDSARKSLARCLARPLGKDWERKLKEGDEKARLYNYSPGNFRALEGEDGLIFVKHDPPKALIFLAELSVSELYYNNNDRPYLKVLTNRWDRKYLEFFLQRK